MSNENETKEITYEAKGGATPRLRFAEFRDAGEWEEKRLFDVASKQIKWSFVGGPFGSNLKASDYTDSGIRIIQLQNIGDGEFNDDYKIFTSEQKADELLSCNIYADEIILSKMGDPVARACLIPNDHQRYIMCSDGIRLVVDEKRYKKIFVYSFINSDQFRRSAEKASTGSTRRRIGLYELKNLAVFAPNLNEQQRIADCLASLDELIAAQAQKLDALKAHKSALLQQLFPAEGESVPRLRFAEFRGAGEWEETQLGSISEVVRGGSPRPIDDYLTTDADGLNWLKIGDVDKNSKYVTNAQERVRPAALSKTREVNPGDLILSNSMSFGRPYILKIKSCIHDGWIAITKIHKRISKDYLYYLMTSPTSQSYFLDNAAGSGVQNLNTDIIKLLPILFPKHPEQQRIADCLSSLDELIAAHAQKLDAFKEHKKGLMQQLFPLVES